MADFGFIYLFGMPGGTEWLLIILFVIIFFGAKKIPELARGLGRGIREFKDATKGVKSEIEEGLKEDDDRPKLNKG
jgi:sec-independent protein translocase protein TatA